MRITNCRRTGRNGLIPDDPSDGVAGELAGAPRRASSPATRVLTVVRPLRIFSATTVRSAITRHHVARTSARLPQPVRADLRQGTPHHRTPKAQLPAARGVFAHPLSRAAD